MTSVRPKLELPWLFYDVWATQGTFHLVTLSLPFGKIATEERKRIFRIIYGLIFIFIGIVCCVAIRRPFCLLFRYLTALSNTHNRMWASGKALPERLVANWIWRARWSKCFYRYSGKSLPPPTMPVALKCVPTYMFSRQAGGEYDSIYIFCVCWPAASAFLRIVSIP